VGDFRVFYDVAEAEVVVIAVLHKRDTTPRRNKRVGTRAVRS